jgi:hypothetical protein
MNDTNDTRRELCRLGYMLGYMLGYRPLPVSAVRRERRFLYRRVSWLVSFFVGRSVQCRAVSAVSVSASRHEQPLPGWSDG